jgi:hypothetical protein
MVLVWFSSGIGMMYYRWPELSETRQLRLLPPLVPTALDSLVGFDSAARVVTAHRDQLHYPPTVHRTEPVSGRLLWWNDRPAYQMWAEQNGDWVRLALVDARTGALLSPVSATAAAQAAQMLVGPGHAVQQIDRLDRGDYYAMNRGYRRDFPAYRVRFDDPSATAAYVGERGGTPFLSVTTHTRITTWLGTVPHWLYFHWLLQDHESLWINISLVLPIVGVFLALTGITLGLSQLFPGRRRGQWRVTGYRGVSRWHHVAGVVFGIVVLIWTFSGILETLGPGLGPRPEQPALARGGPTHWSAIRLTERAALSAVGDSAAPIAIDLLQTGGRPGYLVSLVNGRSAWVDAQSGAVRQDLSPDSIRALAQQAIPGASIASVERLTQFDSYYYARHGRDKPLPVWRVRAADAAGEMLYLDPMTGAPVGYIDNTVRLWRWGRDALHSVDYPVLVNHRPQWDVVVLPLMLGGVLSALTGVWLLVRRVRRMVS